jgi:hypothetical protein
MIRNDVLAYLHVLGYNGPEMVSLCGGAVMGCLIRVMEQADECFAGNEEMVVNSLRLRYPRNPPDTWRTRPALF